MSNRLELIILNPAFHIFILLLENIASFRLPFLVFLKILLFIVVIFVEKKSLTEKIALIFIIAFQIWLILWEDYIFYYILLQALYWSYDCLSSKIRRNNKKKKFYFKWIIILWQNLALVVVKNSFLQIALL